MEQNYELCKDIVATLREPFLLVLDAGFKVVNASQAFYNTFQVTPTETENFSIYELGNKQWDIPRLRELLEEILPLKRTFRNFEVEHDFPHLGKRFMLLNGHQVVTHESNEPGLILLAIEDITNRKLADARLQESENRYRRLFEAAHDGILILDNTNGKIVDANSFITNLLGNTKKELLGKELWEIGLFRDIHSNKEAFEKLQKELSISYSHLPLQTKTGQQIEVEFVSNVYKENGNEVIQCNIRDITERIKLERATVQAEALADLHRRKDEFLAMLSHELRNPLSPILNAF